MASTLGKGTQIHVGRQPARVYRDALRARGIAIEEWDALRALEPLLARAELVEGRGDGELWSSVDEHGVRVDARIVRWRAHAWAVAIAARDAEDATLDGAEWTRPGLEQYARSRGGDTSIEQAEAELRIACHGAVAVDVAAQPEQWRYRSGLDRIDVTLAVVRRGDRQPPLVVAAEAREMSVGRERTRGHRQP